MRFDPVTFEVLKNSLVVLVDQISEQIARTCYSFVIYNGDFSCCLNDFAGNTVMQGSRDIAAHVGTLHYTAKAALEYFKDDLHAGDVIAINDPYLGGTHFPDVRIIRPIFHEGELIALTQANGHWADIGGALPGSFNVSAKECYAEGLRITPVKVWEKGVYRRDVGDLLTNNMRLPNERLGDLRAQAVATGVGERHLEQLIGKYGVRTVLAAFKASQDYVERLLRKKIRALPKGTWTTEDYLDYDPNGEDDKPIRVTTKLEIGEDDLTYDYTGTDDCMSTLLNGAYGNSFSAIIAGTKLFFPEIPLNSGFYRVVKAILPEGSVVNAPWPIPVTGFCSGAFEKIMNSVIELWSYIVPERAMACSYNLEYLLVGGWDNRPGYNHHFMWYDWLQGGHGGRNGKDGSNGSASLFGMAVTCQPFEGQERLAPVLTTQKELIMDSGGPGKWRGGLGIVKAGAMLDSERVMMSYTADRERIVTWGIAGGLPSIPHGLTLKRSEKEVWLGIYCSGVSLGKGDVFSRPSAGGGGYGDPLERDPKMVLEDVLDEYVSPVRAKKDYGVVVKLTDAELGIFEIDLEATSRERKRLRENRKEWLKTDPLKVEGMWLRGEIEYLDALRRYGVILDKRTGKALPNTTLVYRKMLGSRAAKFWVD